MFAGLPRPGRPCCSPGGCLVPDAAPTHRGPAHVCGLADVEEEKPKQSRL